jgi:hypothetical protein
MKEGLAANDFGQSPAVESALAGDPAIDYFVACGSGILAPEVLSGGTLMPKRPGFWTPTRILIVVLVIAAPIAAALRWWWGYAR